MVGVDRRQLIDQRVTSVWGSDRKHLNVLGDESAVPTNQFFASENPVEVHVANVVAHKFLIRGRGAAKVARWEPNQGKK
jgi:hypothetical protein